MLIDDQTGHNNLNTNSVFNRLSRHLLLLAILVTFGISSAAQAQVNQITSINSVCGGDIQGQNYKGCTAGEISISEVINIVFEEGAITECISGTPLTISSATVNYSINTTQRRDLVMWIGDQLGTDPRLTEAAGQTCSAYSLPEPFNPTPDVTNPFGDIDGDQCGDLGFSVSQASRTFTGLTFACQDNNGNGKADAQILLTWSQNNNQACGTNIPVTDPPQSFPTVGAVSKCDFQITDTVLDIVFPPILTLVKQVTNDHGGTGVAGDWTLTATGTDNTVEGTTGVSATVSAGDYDLTESGPGGYDGTWSCVGGSLANDTVTLVNFPSPDPGEAARTTTCTLTNDDQPATLTLVKNVVNDNGGTAPATAWTLSATGPSVISGAGGVGPSQVSAGLYALAETAGPGGYTPSSWSCTGGQNGTDPQVTLALNDVVTCTITNNDDPATLTLVKTVTNDNGGNAVQGDFPSFIDDSPVAWDAAIEVTANAQHTASETPQTGYTPGSWGGDCAADGTITLSPGQSATCSITNNDIAPGLTLVKSVTNDNGGNDPAASFDLTLTGADLTHNNGVDYSTGATPIIISNLSYTVSEIPNAGYTLTSIVCLDNSNQANVGTTFSLNEGQNVTCTFNNDDQLPTLTVVKDVTNDDGGSDAPADWDLRVTGAGGLCGQDGTVSYTSGDSVTTVESNCAYSLSEIQRDFYVQTSVSCADSNGTVPHPVSLNEGQDVTCTIFNDDVLQGSITVVKEVDNDQGGTAVPGDFALHVSGNDGEGNCGEDGAVNRTSPYSVGAPVNGCIYTISETPLAGYTLRGIVCVEDGGATDDGTFTWANGETWTCTVTNDDDGATLTLVKTVTNDNGGSAVVTDWTLTANGPTPISGNSGQPEVTNQNVSAGDYPLSESGGPSGYTPGAWGCIGDGTLSNDSLAIANGETATCTINNNDQTATLTLVKSVTNDHGGTAVADDWTLTADGDTDYAGNTTEFWAGGVAVDADVYTLLESTVDGYAAGAWQCTGGGSLVGNALTLGLNETASCTIVNNDIAPRLTLVKSVTNDNGGAAIADGFTLNLQGVDGMHDTAQDYGNGATPAVKAGVVYIMDETLIDGYANEGVVCEDTGDGGGVVGHPVTLALDQDVTCTITNNDIGPTLELLKAVTNDDGGQLAEGDFTLTLTGTDDGTHDNGADYVSGNTPAIFAAVEYAVSEDTVPDNYTMTGIVCTDTDTQQEIVNPFTPLLAQNISCTVSNDDDAPALTLIKEVINDDGGSATPGTFTLILTGTDGTHDSGVDYSSGDMPVIQGEIEYTVTEIEDPDYEFLGIVCRDVSGADVGNPFTATTGDDITCTATNDDIQRLATFWVTKDFVPDNSMEVEVFISCNDGLPITSDQVITEDSGGVTFVVELFTPGNLDCEITEVPVPGGYDDTYEAFALDGEAGFIGNVDGCQFEEVVGGDFKCEITNTAQDAVFEVNKVWDLIGEGGDRINQVIDISISCTEEILSASPAPDSGPGFFQGRYLVRWLGLEGDTTVRVTVDSSDGTANCRARERIFDDSVEIDNPCRNDRPLTMGQTTVCTMTNTVFFEGIPTLNQYGLAILALLMLGIGAVGFRRFS